MTRWDSNIGRTQCMEMITHWWTTQCSEMTGKGVEGQICCDGEAKLHYTLWQDFDNTIAFYF